MDRQRRQNLAADLGLGRVESVAPAVDAECKRGAAAGLLHRHVDERSVVLLARVVCPRRPQAAGQQSERGEPGRARPRRAAHRRAAPLIVPPAAAARGPGSRAGQNICFLNNATKK